LGQGTAATRTSRPRATGRVGGGDRGAAIRAKGIHLVVEAGGASPLAPWDPGGGTKR